MAKNITAAPAEITLAGKTYLMYPMRDKDNIALDELVRVRFVNIAILTGNDWAVSIALHDCIGLSWTKPPGNKLLNQIGGWGRVVWQGLRLEGEYIDLIADAAHEEIMATIATFRRINDLVEDDTTANPKMGKVLDTIDRQFTEE